MPKLDAEARRRLMARFQSTDTRAELALRNALRRSRLTGYRIHLRTLPGRPDVAYTRWRLAIFVDGLFWHGHPDAFVFGTKGDYWDAKIRRNQDRDRTVTEQLSEAAWDVLRLWDRDVLRDPTAAVIAIAELLARKGHRSAIEVLPARPASASVHVD